MSKVTTKQFTIVYSFPNEAGVYVSKTAIINDVIGDLVYEGAFIVLRIKDDSVRRFHQDRCIDINEVITQREAISAPAI